MTETTTISPLRQRMIEDMVSRQIAQGTQIGHIRACRRFAAWLKRLPDTASVDEVRAFQLHLMVTGNSIQTRNRTVTGLRFLFSVSMRRLDLANEIHHIKEPTRIPRLAIWPTRSRAFSSSLKARTREALANCSKIGHCQRGSALPRRGHPRLTRYPRLQTFATSSPSSSSLGWSSSACEIKHRGQFLD